MRTFFLSFLLFICVVAAQECQEGQEEGECANPAVAAEEEVPEQPPRVDVDPKCPDRGHITRCAGAYLDTNKNGKLDREELDAAIGKLPWYGRGIVKILGSTDKMMKKCELIGLLPD